MEACGGTGKSVRGQSQPSLFACYCKTQGGGEGGCTDQSTLVKGFPQEVRALIIEGSTLPSIQNRI